MKVNTRLCDICGNDIYQHARHTYTIRKRMWELGGDVFGERLDLCEDCWNRLVAYIRQGAFLKDEKKMRKL